MGQHASTQSGNRSAYPDVPPILRHRNVSNSDMVISEDETMVDVSSASSVVSGGRTSTSRRSTSRTRLQTQSRSTSSNRPTRRSSLWCRVQSLRNRIYRTTRSVNLVTEPNQTNRPATSSAAARRSIFGEPSSTSRRRSVLFGTPPRPRPQSYHSPDPFTDNIDPRYESSDDRRPRTAYTLSGPRSRSTRSIWGPPSSSPHPPPALPTLSSLANSSSVNPTLSTTASTLPTVIDHSTQTSSINHPIQPFNITRRPGEDQAEMLSRFLYVAGAALAASLVASTDTATSQLQDFSAEFADASDEDLANAPEGSFEGFLRALRQGRAQFAHALRSDSENMSIGGEDSGSGFTYLLMYRFSSLTTPPSSQQTNAERPTEETNMETTNGTSMAVETRPPTPYPPDSSESTSPPNETSSSTSEPRMVPFVIIGVQPVPPRDTGHTNVPTFSEGVASLIANARQTTSQIRPQTSGGSSSPDTTTPLRETTSIPSALPGSWRDSPPPSDPVRRRASVDGSFRNNGSPTHREPSTRAWQMYIYGGAYPENHLIFTAPTLFTDSPSSEDMLLLASILGEVKPPVASKEEIEAAGGISRVGEEPKISEGDRCLVCLSDYEQGEECRTLSACRHIFHRECIDEWLASGRNACPLCRGVGVATQEKTTPGATTTPPTSVSSANDVNVGVE